MWETTEDMIRAYIEKHVNIKLEMKGPTDPYDTKERTLEVRLCIDNYAISYDHVPLKEITGESDVE